MDKVIGIDLGGTNIKAALVNKKGELVSDRIEIKSGGTCGVDTVIDNIVGVINQILGNNKSDINIGLAIPGHVDSNHGIVKWSPNLGSYKGSEFTCWKNVPVVSYLKKKVNNKIYIGNDANLAALSEYTFGIGRNTAECLVMITLGTGVGSGVVMDSKCISGNSRGPLLLLGGNHAGLELGHLCIKPDGLSSRAGLYGTVESYCGKQAIIDRAIHKLRYPCKSILREMVDNQLQNITPKILFLAAEQNDEIAIETWNETGRYLGILLGNCINIFSPDMISIGGKIAKAWKYMEKNAISEAKKCTTPNHFQGTIIQAASHLDSAGILGAAALAMQS